MVNTVHPHQKHTVAYTEVIIINNECVTAELGLKVNVFRCLTDGGAVRRRTRRRCVAAAIVRLYPYSTCPLQAVKDYHYLFVEMYKVYDLLFNPLAILKPYTYHLSTLQREDFNFMLNFYYLKTFNYYVLAYLNR